MDRNRLGRIRAALQRQVDRGAVPGAVGLVHHGGHTHGAAVGLASFGGAPMSRDSIFRIASVSKPIAAAATMVLVEDGVLRLDDPVHEWLPELADRRVLTNLDGPLDDTVAAHRPITVRDLLTMRMGFGIVWADPAEIPILTAAAELGIVLGPPTPPSPHEPDEWLRRFGTLPLMAQPGEQWMYETPFTVLGVLLARATGMGLPALLHQLVFDPLGMRDTGFGVPGDSLDRFTDCYATGPEGTTVVHDPAVGGDWSNRTPALVDAAGDLVSTADDLLAFGRMLLEGGRGLLSRAAVTLMTTDQLTAEQKARSTFFPGFFDNHGWGLGVAICTRRDALWATPGRFGWDGGYGTSLYCDPAEGLVGVYLTQHLADESTWAAFDAFWTATYQAME